MEMWEVLTLGLRKDDSDERPVMPLRNRGLWWGWSLDWSLELRRVEMEPRRLLGGPEVPGSVVRERLNWAKVSCDSGKGWLAMMKKSARRQITLYLYSLVQKVIFEHSWALVCQVQYPVHYICRKLRHKRHQFLRITHVFVEKDVNLQEGKLCKRGHASSIIEF